MACIQAVAALPSTGALTLSAVSNGQRFSSTGIVVRLIRSERLTAVCGPRPSKPSEAAPARRSSSSLRLLSAPVAAVPLVLAFVEAELPGAIDTFTALSDFHITEPALKAFYMIFTCVFCWGALVFASMNDEYYESDEYRDAGGNGTQFWIYQRAEEEEEANREELWRDELRREIEEKVTGVKGLKGAVKEEELV